MADALNAQQTAFALAHAATGTYCDHERMRYVQIAVVDGKPLEIGWIRANVPVEMRRLHERRVWNRFLEVK